MEIIVSAVPVRSASEHPVDYRRRRRTAGRRTPFLSKLALRAASVASTPAMGHLARPNHMNRL
jgi:hypothetical protein